MSRQSNEQSLGEVIRELLNTYKLEGKINQARIIEAWEEVVGVMIMKHTRNLYVKGRKLFVELDSPALKTELSYSKTRIIASLNEKAGAEIITDVIFR
jgi:predicted nucleic acid-binding Zn ribbon protein